MKKTIKALIRIMIKMGFIWPVIALACMITGSVYAANADLNAPSSFVRQQVVRTIVVKGRVTDKQGKPLPGVTVILKGTTFGVATDSSGRYEMTIQKEYATTLVFSFVGMKTREIAINGRTEINVKLEEDTKEMDEVVVTGIFKGVENV